MPKPKLLVVEDNESLRKQMKWSLAEDYEVQLAEDRNEAMSLFMEHTPKVVTLDLGLPPDPDGVSEGFETLFLLLQQDPGVKVIIVTGRTERKHALAAVTEGAYDFFCKPIDMDEFKIVLNRAFHLADIEEEYRKAREGRAKPESFQGILGVSPQMEKIFSTTAKIADTEHSVLVEGESGTGKELVAHAIHNLSSRKNGPFVAINCGAIPENLLESELFGHEKGAFTGAHALKKGRIESAQGGTLFLDEVGELPLPLQVKILRFLQDGKLVRVGGRREIGVDVRVVSATNKNLKEAVEKGHFREDLYYRLAVLSLFLPPLKEREGDAVFLARALLDKYLDDNKKKLKGFTTKALKAIETYGWPGNVRELENRIKRAVVMATGNLITPADLDLDLKFSNFHGLSLREAREALEKEFITAALLRHKGNITKTAAELQVSRPTLYELMEKLGIER